MTAVHLRFALFALLLCAFDAGCSCASDTAPDTDVTLDPGSDEALSAFCMAVTDEASCDSARPQSNQVCEDCYHSCVWMQLHETTRTADECVYGETRGRCVYMWGGEGGGAELMETCADTRPFDGPGQVVQLVEGERQWLGHVRWGSMPYSDVGLCTDSSSSAESVCKCPCLPGYPDAECEPLPQVTDGGTPSGMEQCPGVPVHRAHTQACSNRVGADGCETDADCPADAACVCRHKDRGVELNQCVTGACRTDDDCPGDEVCGLSYSGAGDSCEVTTLQCREPYALCDGRRCDFGETCAYDQGTGGWDCTAAGACY